MMGVILALMDDRYHLNQMRHSREEKARSTQRIVDIAAQRIREQGVDGPGVAEIMKAAGMTHGGFYKHFDSRDDLIAAAVETAMRDPEEGMAAVIANATDPLAAFVDWYVSADHVADPGHGCGVASLTGDIAHSDTRLRAAYHAQVERYLTALEGMLGSRSRATVALATLVGAVTVARALGTAPLADEILRDVRQALKAQPAG
jgi:TetR/AcrR family transcriptional regulator, transcriptional repressor for nem operon